MANYLRVIHAATGEIVKRIDVTGKSERQVEKVLAGLLINMDRDRFYVEGPEAGPARYPPLALRPAQLPGQDTRYIVLATSGTTVARVPAAWADLFAAAPALYHALRRMAWPGSSPPCWCLNGPLDFRHGTNHEAACIAASAALELAEGAP